MSSYFCKEHKIKYKIDANTICKEQFTNLIKNSRQTRTEILIEAVGNYDIPLACQRNSSFSIFVDWLQTIKK